MEQEKNGVKYFTKKTDKAVMPRVLILFAMVFISLSLIVGLFDITFYDLKKADTKANLASEKNKCDTSHGMMLENERDLFGNERTGADSNSFRLTNRCYKMMNDYSTVYNLTMKKFDVGYIMHYVWILLLAILISGLYMAYIITTEYEDENEKCIYY